MSSNALPITIMTHRVLHAVFPPALWERLEKTLMFECGPLQVHSPDFGREAMERIWLATLKQSNGSIDAFEDAVLLAQTDWRDLLVNAEFSNDLAAHLIWAVTTAG